MMERKSTAKSEHKIDMRKPQPPEFPPSKVAALTIAATAVVRRGLQEVGCDLGEGECQRTTGPVKSRSA